MCCEHDLQGLILQHKLWLFFCRRQVRSLSVKWKCSKCWVWSWVLGSPSWYSEVHDRRETSSPENPMITEWMLFKHTLKCMRVYKLPLVQGESKWASYIRIPCGIDEYVHVFITVVDDLSPPGTSWVRHQTFTPSGAECEHKSQAWSFSCLSIRDQSASWEFLSLPANITLWFRKTLWLLMDHFYFGDLISERSFRCVQSCCIFTLQWSVKC